MKFVSRRSFMKMAGVTALAVAGTVALGGCSASQVMVPLQFDSALIGDEAARKLDEAQLKVVYTTNEVVLNQEVLAAVKTVSSVKIDWSQYCIYDIKEEHDTLDGKDSVILKVYFAPAML